MAELKTKQNEASVERFLASIADQQKQTDSRAICDLMADITGEPAKMWGNSIVGFGKYNYKYASERAGDWPITAFSPRKATLTIYIVDGFKEHQKLLDQLGKYSTSVSCLYIKKLDDIDIAILKKLIESSVKTLKQIQ